MNYQGEGLQVAPLERAMRLSDEVIRYLTIKVNKTKSKELDIKELDVNAEVQEELEQVVDT